MLVLMIIGGMVALIMLVWLFAIAMFVYGDKKKFFDSIRKDKK